MPSPSFDDVTDRPHVTIDWYTGDRRALRPLFELAEDSGAELDSYLDAGRPAVADVGNLRFYQRQGFRMRSIDREAFTTATGYEANIEIDGIPLRDRVWLSLEIGSA